MMSPTYHPHITHLLARAWWPCHCESTAVASRPFLHLWSALWLPVLRSVSATSKWETDHHSHLRRTVNSYGWECHASSKNNSVSVCIYHVHVPPGSRHQQTEKKQKQKNEKWNESQSNRQNISHYIFLTLGGLEKWSWAIKPAPMCIHNSTEVMAWISKSFSK